MEYDRLLEVAIEAAKKAGDFLLKREGISIDSDAGRDIKLSSDKLSENIIIDVLARTNIPILSEERGLIGKNSGTYWIVDPLDGTVNYFKGINDMACVSIALWDNESPVIGVVNRFACGEMFTGVAGQGAKLNGVEIRPSDISRTEKAVLCTGFPVGRDHSENALTDFVHRIQHFKKVRMLGAAAIMVVFVACGRVDAYVEEDIMIWDVAGAMAIVEASGGAVRLEMREGHRCVFRCFSNNELMEDSNAKGI